MPRVTDAHHQSQRRKILASAIDVFAERGYGLTTVDEVCRRAGLSKGALYSYFSSKEQLFIAASKETFDRRYKSIAEASVDELPSLQKVRTLLDGFEAYLESEDRTFIRLWVEAYLQGDRLPALEEMKTSYRRRFGDLLEAAIRTGQQEGSVDPRLDPELGADTVMALADGLMLHSLMPGWKVDSKRIIRSLSQMLTPFVGRCPDQSGAAPLAAGQEASHAE